MALTDNTQISPGLCKYINPTAARKTRRLLLLGASGSIGQTTLAFLKGQEEIELMGLSVHSSIDFVRNYLSDQPPFLSHVAISAPRCLPAVKELRSAFPHISFYSGPNGLLEMIACAAREGADTVLTAIVGAAGIQVTIEAIRLGLKIGLANKEALVTAGPAIQAAMVSSLKTACEQGSERQACLLPVDSEHNSVFRLAHKLEDSALRRVILTASGGSLRSLPPEELTTVTRAEVLRHPNWSMGPKITVDSAGMINKGLEIIEAHYLFSLPYEALGVWIHRDSLVHALLELSDGSYLFHACSADMVFPIAHVLFFPQPIPRVHSLATAPPQWNSLSFQEPSTRNYPGFYLCLEAGRTGGTAPAILNAANEIAVAAFLRDEIHFTTIVDVIKSVLDEAEIQRGNEVEVFLEADRWARGQALRYLSKAGELSKV